MGNEINKTHKNVVGYMNRETYVITYNEYIYNDCRDGIELEKIVQSSLKPKEYDNSGSWCGMSGFFIKDNIRVNTYWNDMMDYLWKIDTDDDAVKNKVYEWAVLVYEAYKKTENKSDSE